MEKASRCMLSLFSSLWQAYKKCSTEKERELLLSDIKAGDNKRCDNFDIITEVLLLLARKI